MFSRRMRDIAKKKYRRLVLPEGSDIRILKAARILVDEKITSSTTVIGKTKEIKQLSEENDISLTGIQIVDPPKSESLEEFKAEYYELRKHKGISKEKAEGEIITNLNWGAMMVRKGYADAMVAGAENPTGKVLVAAFKIIKTSPGTKYASSCFVMDFQDKKWGVDGNMIFSDCAIIPDPSSEQLAEIAVSAAVSCRRFLNAEPIVALLSFSTKGSARHPSIDKIKRALSIIKERDPALKVDGELQADAALIPFIARQKAPGSKIAGKANVLIFPDLEAGNIGYKLVQRFANAEAYGPFLQGFAKPVSDLSRGCSVEDVVNTAAVTLVQTE